MKIPSGSRPRATLINVRTTIRLPQPSSTGHPPIIPTGHHPHTSPQPAGSSRPFLWRRLTSGRQTRQFTIYVCPETTGLDASHLLQGLGPPHLSHPVPRCRGARRSEGTKRPRSRNQHTSALQARACFDSINVAYYGPRPLSTLSAPHVEKTATTDIQHQEPPLDPAYICPITTGRTDSDVCTKRTGVGTLVRCSRSASRSPSIAFSNRPAFERMATGWREGAST